MDQDEINILWSDKNSIVTLADMYTLSHCYKIYGVTNPDCCFNVCLKGLSRLDIHHKRWIKFDHYTCNWYCHRQA